LSLCKVSSYSEFIVPLSVPFFLSCTCVYWYVKIVN
jgi:hypothetical protein